MPSQSATARLSSAATEERARPEAAELLDAIGRTGGDSQESDRNKAGTSAGRAAESLKILDLARCPGRAGGAMMRRLS